ncbi:MAG TPA: IS1380 family transposase [Ilumatobacteraceae bacterium]
MTRVSQTIDRFEATFDDDTLVADAGLIVPATLMGRLGVEQVVNEMVDLGGRVGGASPGRKVTTLVASMLGGGTHIDHANKLRAGSTGKVLPFRVMAPSTLGTFLRSFTFGHVRQLDAVIAETTRRAWAVGAGPGAAAMTIDLDSTICEVHGHLKGGAAYGYTRQLGYHPLLATWAATGDVLHARMRKGSANTQRGAKRFVEELIARVRRNGASGPLCVRADSGFYAWDTIDTLTRLEVAWSVTVNINASIRTAIEAIPENAWIDIAYPDGGVAQVAETTYVTGGGKTKRAQRRVRLVVRRTRLVDPTQLRLWPNWRHHAFVTNTELDTVAADEFHRDHATVELAIRDLKAGAGLEHCPSGKFNANAAWLVCAVLAHNLVRWTARLGNIHPAGQLTVSNTVRQRVFGVPGRLVNRSGRPTLRLPTRWPWAATFITALNAIRSLPLTT